MKHVAVTQKQFDKTWSDLPPQERYFDEDNPRTKAGYLCYTLGDMLLWVDYLMPEDQWSEEVQSALEAIRSKKIYQKGEVG